MRQREQVMLEVALGMARLTIILRHSQLKQVQPEGVVKWLLEAKVPR